MKITDDRGVERELRVSTGRVKDVTVSGFLMLLHSAVLIVISVAVFGLSCLGSSVVFEHFKLGGAGSVGAIISASALTVGAVVLYLRQVSSTRSCVSTPVNSRSCRACGYAMDGLGVDGDGCRVCPECGAAWRASTSGGDA